MNLLYEDMNLTHYVILIGFLLFIILYYVLIRMESHTINLISSQCYCSLLTKNLISSQTNNNNIHNTNFDSPSHQTLIKLNNSFMESAGEPGSSFQFPPGFRFHPSDEELIVHYLQNKVNSRSIPATIIAEVDLYKHNPWELPEKALFGEKEWYFFSPREKKYPNGARPNRAAGVGYWKATATDKPIFGCSGLKRLGVKKALVFYTGRAPRGVKTDWMMNEYRLIDTTTRLKGTMRLDDWVLCRVRLKGNSMLRHTWKVHDTHNTEMVEYYMSQIEEACPIYTKNNHDMITDSLYKECQLLTSSVFSDKTLPPIESISSVSCQGSKIGNSFEKLNSPVIGSSLDTYFKPLKRKPSEENVYDQNILLSNKKPDVDYRDENFLLGKAFPNYYSQLQDVYLNLSDPVNDFQKLN